jgi:nitrogen fixation protein NifU and related proteins
MHSAAVLDHFKNPRNAGELPGATAEVDVTNPVCGDVLRLAANVENGRIVEVRFKAQGCVTAVAATSVLTELMAGKTIDEAGAISAETISTALGGLTPATMHGAQLAAESAAALLAKVS